MPHDHRNHDHDHGEHSRGGAGHSHRVGVTEQRLFWVALLTGGFMIAEAAGGLFAGSLALLADAGHTLSDFVALVLAWLAFRVSRRPPDSERTYGFDRLQVLAAFTNGLAMLVIAVWITVEAVQRFLDPVDVIGWPVLAIGALGLVVNAIAYLALRGGDHANLNVRGAMVHVLGDMLGSAGAIVAGIVIMTTGWSLADPLVSVLVVLLILRASWMIVRDSAHILLEGVPASLTTTEVKEDLQAEIDAIEDVHHVHAWSITQERPMVTLHAKLKEGAEFEGVVEAIKQRLRVRFGIFHATIELERHRCADDGAEPPADHALAAHSH